MSTLSSFFMKYTKYFRGVLHLKYNEYCSSKWVISPTGTLAQGHCYPLQVWVSLHSPCRMLVEIKLEYFEVYALHILGIGLHSIVSSVQDPFLCVSVTLYGPSHVGPRFPYYRVWLALLLLRTQTPNLKAFSFTLSLQYPSATFLYATCRTFDCSCFSSIRSRFCLRSSQLFLPQKCIVRGELIIRSVDHIASMPLAS